MTDLELDQQVRRLVRNTIPALGLVKAPAQKRKMEGTPVRDGNRYACLYRALFVVETSLRAAAAERLQIAGPLFLALEVVVLARVGLDTAGNALGAGRPAALQFLAALEARQAALLETLRGTVGPEP